MTTASLCGRWNQVWYSDVINSLRMRWIWSAHPTGWEKRKSGLKIASQRWLKIKVRCGSLFNCEIQTLGILMLAAGFERIQKDKKEFFGYMFVVISLFNFSNSLVRQPIIALLSSASTCSIMCIISKHFSINSSVFRNWKVSHNAL